MKTTLITISFTSALGGLASAVAFVAGASATGLANPLAWFAAFAGSFVLLTTWNDYGVKRRSVVALTAASSESPAQKSAHALAA